MIIFLSFLMAIFGVLVYGGPTRVAIMSLFVTTALALDMTKSSSVITSCIASIIVLPGRLWSAYGGSPEFQDYDREMGWMDGTAFGLQVFAILFTVLTIISPVSIHDITAMVTGLLFPVLFHRLFISPQQYDDTRLLCWVGLWTSWAMFSVMSNIIWIMVTLVIGLGFAAVSVLLELSSPWNNAIKSLKIGPHVDEQ